MQLDYLLLWGKITIKKKVKLPKNVVVILPSKPVILSTAYVILNLGMVNLLQVRVNLFHCIGNFTP